MSDRAARFSCAAWALAALLLAKSMLPLLAASAAGWRAQELVEICTVYGLRSVAAAPSQRDTSGLLSGSSETPSSSADKAEVCALGWLPPAGPLPADSDSSRWQADAALPGLASPCETLAPADAVRAWRALLKQGPPRA